MNAFVDFGLDEQEDLADDSIRQMQNFVGQVQTLLEVSQTFVREPRCARALEIVLDAIGHVVPIAGIELLAADSQGSFQRAARYFRDLKTIDFETLREAKTGRFTRPVASRLARHCLESRTPHQYTKADDAGRIELDPAGDELTVLREIRATLASPILIGPTVAGVLLLHSSNEAGFDRPSMRLIMTLASFVSSVFHRHHIKIDHQQSQGVLRRVIDAANQGIVLVGRDRRIIMTNDVANRHLAGLFQQTVQEIVVDRDFLGNVAEYFAEGHAFVDRATSWFLARTQQRDVVCTKDGRYLDVQIVSIDDLGHLFQVNDVTVEKRIEEDLRTARDDAESANRSKSDFLANMSHEIRTPMTAILGYSDVLLGEEGLENAPPERQSAFKAIRRNGEHLMEIINDILDLSKIESGRMVVEHIPCDPFEIVANVVSLLRVRAKTGGLALDVEYQGPIPRQIQSDPTRLRQILLNLVGNAIKFTKQGGIRIVARYVGTPDSSMEFDVIDTGIGISEEQQRQLFKPFSQADTSTTRKYGGTGLGLVISRRLARLLGGDIEMCSQTGKGTTFTVTVSAGDLTGVDMVEHPTEAAIEPVALLPSNESAKPLDGLRILVAEDGPDNQRIIRFFLKKAGADVTVVENGLLACQHVQQRASSPGTAVDVVLMDMQMPVMDGYTAVRKLRTEGFGSLPILALTAHAMQGDREKCLQAGCDEYTTKPIKREELLSKIRECHTRANRQTSA